MDKQELVRYLKSLLERPLSRAESVAVYRFLWRKDRPIATASSEGATATATWIGEGLQGDWPGLPDDVPMVRLDVYYPDRPDRYEPHWTACTCIDARTNPETIAALCLAAARGVSHGLRRQFLAGVSLLASEDITTLQLPKPR